jgi:hypothetical protein
MRSYEQTENRHTNMVKPTQTHLCEDGTKRKIKFKTEDMNKWVSDLVSRTRDREPSTATKADRMERRSAKKRHYEQTRQQDHQGGLLNTSSKSSSSKRRRDFLINTSSWSDPSDPRFPDRTCDRSECETDRKSVIRLKLLTGKLEECLILVEERRRKRQKPFLPVPAPLAKKDQRYRLHTTNFLQPRASGYGGIGLARPSLYIPFDDPSWKPKLEEEFVEHIPGFFGKQRTKAMKKQLDGQMLWRQLLKQKEKQSQTKRRIKINGRNIATMTPDERVDVLLRTGAI